MAHTKCNSFYENSPIVSTADTGSTIVNQTAPVSFNNLTQKFTDTGIVAEEVTPVLTTEIPFTTVPVTSADEVNTATTAKKRSTLWIWAASYFAAILISPSENMNYVDKSNNNVTP